MADPFAIELAASAARTASGSGSPFDITTRRRAARLTLDVSVVSGTFAAGQGLTVSIETSPNGATGWRPVGAFALTSIAGYEPRRGFAELQRYVRASWVLTGTNPSFTFSVAGEAHVLYCAPSDLTRYGISAAALEGIAAETQADGCLDATDYADSKIRSRYTLPLVSWSEDFTGHCARVAIENIITVRGFDPEGADELIRDRGKWARSELASIGAGRTSPALVDSTPTKRGASPRVHSRNVTSGWDEDADT